MVSTKFCFLLLAVYGMTTQSETFGQPEEENVVVLTDSTFHDFLAKHNVVMAEFYAPWCGHCKSLAPHYAKLAEMMKKENPPVPICKIDATKETKLADEFKIEGYPTLKLFINGTPINYSGEHDEQAIFDFIKKKSGPASAHLKSADEMETHAKHKISIIYTVEEGDAENLKSFMDFARTFDEIPFAHTHAVHLPHKFSRGSKSKIVMYREFDDGHKELEIDTFDHDKVTKFVKEYRRPLVTVFDREAADFIFGGEHQAAFLFVLDSAKADTKDFKKAAEKHKDRAFSVSDIDQGLGEKLSEYLGITKKDAGKVVLLNFEGSKLNKIFCPESNYEGIEKCIIDAKEGKLKPTLKSEEIPKENNDPVKIVVGKNFEEIVKKSNKHVLLEIYAPWCGHCKALEPKYNKAAELLKDNKDIIIAKMDGTANEVEDIEIQGFPTIFFYHKDDKKAVNFDGARNTKGILSFLEKKTGLDLKSSQVEDEKEEHDHDHGNEFGGDMGEGDLGLDDDLGKGSDETDL